MAEGFKIAEAFVELHSESSGLREEVKAETEEAAIGQEIKVPVRPDKDSLGQAFAPFIGSLGQWAAGLALPIAGTITALSGATAVALPIVAGLGIFAGAAKIGLENMGKAIEGDKKSLDKLAPSAKTAATEIGKLVEGLKVGVQQAMWEGLAGKLQGLSTTIMPVLHGALLGAAGVINDILGRFLTWAAKTATVKDMKTTFDNITTAGHNLAKAVGPILDIIRNIGTEASKFLPALATHFANAAQKAADFIQHARDTGKLHEWIQTGLDTLKKLWQVLKDAATAVIDLSKQKGFSSDFLTGVGTIISGVGWLAKHVPDLTQIITLFFAAWKLVQLVKGIVLVINIVKEWTAVQWLLDLALDANPIGILIIAIGLLIAAVILTIKYWKDIKKVLEEVWNWIKDNAVRIFNDVKNFIVRIFNDVKDFFIRIWNDIKDFAVRIFNDIKDFAVRIFNDVKDFIVRIFNDVKDFFIRVWNDIKDFIHTVWSGIEGIIQGAVNIIKGILNWFGNLPGMIGGWFRDMANTANGWIGSLIGFVASIPGRVLGALGDLGGLLWNAGKSLIEGFWNGIKAMFDWVWGQVGNLMGKLRNLWPFSPAKEGPFSGTGYTSYSGQAMMRDWAKGMLGEQGTVQSAVQKVMGGIQSTFAQPSFGAVALAGGASGGAVPVGSTGSTTHVGSLTVQVAGNLDPTNPTAYRQAISGIRDAIRGVERSFQ